MLKIKNNCLWCNEETNNPKYCNLSCQNSHKNKIAREKRIEQYNKNPKKCENPDCDVCLEYEKRANKYCSHSCSGTMSNKSRTPEYMKKQVESFYKNEKFKYLEEDITTDRYKQLYPYCPVKFLICEFTGLPYCNKNFNGETRQRSPYISTEKEKYYDLCKFRFSVHKYPEEFDLKLIEEFGWYTCPGKKRKNYTKNINGVSRDHLYSISEGFKNNVNPLLLSHPANCRVMIHIDNIKKSIICDITLNELKERIIIWENKYNTFPNIKQLVDNDTIYCGGDF